MENHRPVLSVLHVCMVIIDRLLRGVSSAIQTSGEASSTFGHVNANFFVFIDRIRNQFLKK